MTKTDAKPDQSEPVDFSAHAKRAEKLRLASDLDAAEAMYAEIAELGSAAAEGYGNHHLALCARARGDQATEIGASDLAASFYEEAVVLYDKAFLFYFEAGNPVRSSAAMLDKGVLSLRRGNIEQAIEEITESLNYLEDHADEESDRGFVDEHRGIKYARLAEAHLADQDVQAARKVMNQAEDTPQRNPYFVMVTTEIEGYVCRAEDDATGAEEAWTTVVLKADTYGDTDRKRRILGELEVLKKTVDAGLPASTPRSEA